MSPGPDPFEELLADVDAAIEHGSNLADIQERLEAVESQFSDEPEYWFHRAATQIDQPDCVRAFVGRGVALARTDPEMLLRAAEVSYFAELLDDAGRYLAELRPLLDPADQTIPPLAMGIAGMIHHRRGRFEDAEAALAGAVRIRPDVERHVAALARLYVDQGRYHEALAVAEEALRSHPGSPELIAVRDRAGAGAPPSRPWRSQGTSTGGPARLRRSLG